MEVFLAKTSPNALILAKMGIVFMRFIFVAFCLYLASQALMNLPLVRSYLAQPKYFMLFQILVLGTAFLIVYYIPSLRLLHASSLVVSRRHFVWPDIILSALALGRMSYIWHYLFRWLERRSS